MLSFSGCFTLVTLLHHPTTPKLSEERLTDGRDVREFVVFEDPSTGDPGPASIIFCAYSSGVRLSMSQGREGESSLTKWRQLGPTDRRPVRIYRV